MQDMEDFVSNLETAKEAIERVIHVGATTVNSAVAQAIQAKAVPGNLAASATTAYQEKRLFDMARLSLLPTGLSSSVSAVLDYCNRFVPNMVDDNQTIEAELRMAEMEDAAIKAEIAPSLERNLSALSMTRVIQDWSRSIPNPVTVTPEKTVVPITVAGNHADDKEFDPEAITAAAELIMARHEKMAVDNILSLKRGNSDAFFEPLPVGLKPLSAEETKSSMGYTANGKTSYSGNILQGALTAESAWVAGGSAATGGFSVSNGNVSRLPPLMPRDIRPVASPRSAPALKSGESLSFPTLRQIASTGSTGLFHVDVEGFFGTSTIDNTDFKEDVDDDALSFNSDVTGFDVADEQPMSTESGFWEKPASLVASTSLGSINIDGDDKERHSDLSLHPGFYTL